MSAPIRVLCVEADRLMQLDLRRIVERNAAFPLTVSVVANCGEALRHVTDNTPDVICIAVEDLEDPLTSTNPFSERSDQQAVGNVADLLWDLPGLYRKRTLVPPYVILLTNGFTAVGVENRFIPLGASTAVHRDHFRAHCQNVLQRVMRRGRPIVPSASVAVVYAPPDLGQAEKICDRLKEMNFRPWIDTRDIPPGRDRLDGLAQGIRGSEFCLVCLSAETAKPGAFHRTLRAALKTARDQGKEYPEDDIFLIPARLNQCPVPTSLRRFEIVDLFAEAGWKRLVRALRVSVEQRARVRPLRRRARILVLDSDRGLCDELQTRLEDVGCEVRSTPRVDEALEFLASTDFEFAVVGVDLDDTMSFAVLRTLRSVQASTTVLAMTNFDDPRIANVVQQLGVHEYLIKDRLIARKIAVLIRHELGRPSAGEGS